MKKYAYNLSSWFLAKETIEEFKEGAEGDPITNISEASKKSKSVVISLLVIRGIYEIIRLSLAAYFAFYLIYFTFLFIDFYSIADSSLIVYLSGLLVSILLLLYRWKKPLFSTLSIAMSLLVFYGVSIYYIQTYKEVVATVFSQTGAGVVSKEGIKIQPWEDVEDLQMYVEFDRDTNSADENAIFQDRIAGYIFGSYLDFTDWAAKNETIIHFITPNSIEELKLSTAYRTGYIITNPTDLGLRLAFFNGETDTAKKKTDTIKSLNYIKFSVKNGYKVVISNEMDSKQKYVIIFNTAEKENFELPKDITVYNCSDNFDELPEGNKEQYMSSYTDCSYLHNDRSYIVVNKGAELSIKAK